MPYRIVLEYDPKTRRNTTLVSDAALTVAKRDWFVGVWAAKGVTDSVRALADWKRSGYAIPKWHPFLNGGKI